MSPTARTLAELRRLGFLAAPVERYLPAVKRTRDLFGIGDVLGFHVRDRFALLVQCTTTGHLANRMARIRKRPELPLLLKAGVQVECWGWARRGGRWMVKRVGVQAEDLAPVVLQAPRPRRRRKGESQRDLFN